MFQPSIKGFALIISFTHEVTPSIHPLILREIANSFHIESIRHFTDIHDAA